MEASRLGAASATAGDTPQPRRCRILNPRSQARWNPRPCGHESDSFHCATAGTPRPTSCWTWSRSHCRMSCPKADPSPPREGFKHRILAAMVCAPHVPGTVLGALHSPGSFTRSDASAQPPSTDMPISSVRQQAKEAEPHASGHTAYTCLS